jgi:DNA-binding transcriptional ArsR family regulator
MSRKTAGIRLTRYSASWLNIAQVQKRDTRLPLDAYEAIFTALAHPARRRILITVHFNRGEMTAGEIARVFEHAWQTTTRHLQVLEAAGLLTHERRGRSRVYRLERKRLEMVREWLAWFSARPQPARR